MTVAANILPRLVVFGTNGLPAAGGKLYTYANKTTTPQATYQDAAGTTANANPIVLDSAGSAVVFLTSGQTYTYKAEDSAGNVLWTLDDITGQAGGLDISSLQAAVQLGIQPWSSTATYAAKSRAERGGVTYYAVTSSTNVDPATDDGSHWLQWGFTLAQLTALGYLTETAGDARYQQSYAVANIPRVPVRQTTLAGPTDSNGLPNWLPSTSASLSITMQNVSSSDPLVFTAAGGNTTNGTENRTSSNITSNQTWGSLASNSTNYLYADIAADGSVTLGSTIIAPVYQFGGTYNVGNGAWTFNIQDMTGKLGNGTTASMVYRVFVGEATTDSSTVTSAVAYAHMGRYESQQTSFTPTATYSVSMNLGITPRDYCLELVCQTADVNYQPGTIIRVSPNDWDSTISRGMMLSIVNANTMSVATGNGYPFIPDANGGAGTGLTAGRWKFRVRASRGF